MWEWGPVRVVNSRKTNRGSTLTDICVYFCPLTLEKQLADRNAGMFVCWKELFQGYSLSLSVFTGSLFLTLSLRLSLSISPSVCLCFLRARSDMSSESRLSEMVVHCRQLSGTTAFSRVSEGVFREGSCKISLPNT